ncbi:MAG: hypothetical protein GY774_20535 [Planctomycetes bacterium]|nr:hypothetical protein [Planctomycetota bacterium]
MINPVGSRVIYYRSLKIMQHRNNKTRSSMAMNLVETILALAVTVIIFAPTPGLGTMASQGCLNLVRRYYHRKLIQI